MMLNGAATSSAMRDAIKELQRDSITQHIDEAELLDALNSVKLQDSIAAAEYHKATKSSKFHERLTELREARFGEVNQAILTQKNYHGFSGIILAMH